MMKLVLPIAILTLFSCVSVAQTEEIFTANTSVTWSECIRSYEELDTLSEHAYLIEMGKSDIGKPIHLFVINKGAKHALDFNLNRSILLINNAIHPGEPCGVDASIKFAHALLTNNEKSKWLDSLIVCIIPMYNVGGALNRQCCVRANQVGPEQYGFRGNAKNLDLNRDFIKADSRNAFTFFEIYHQTHPHVFIDTHTSNGADYQYVMTMIATQPDKAGEEVGRYIKQQMSPSLYASMEAEGFGMTPYVYTMKKVPDHGIKDFLETPRYATGYTALFNTIGFTSETHMLKPFAQRVQSTYAFLCASAEYMASHNHELLQLKKDADRHTQEQEIFELRWELDTTQWRMIPFKGFKPVYEDSKVSEQRRLRYDRKKPVDMQIRYYDTYVATREVKKPSGYIFSQAWSDVIDRLAANGIEMTRLKKDTIVSVEAYYIDAFSSASNVYEGHHPNNVERLHAEQEQVQFYQGDVIVRCDQVSNRYIIETLEPEGMDSFFTWNFFDSAMQQKEWYSDYVFEDTAAELLEKDPDLKAAFERAKIDDPRLNEDASAQLYWIYLHSPFKEATLNRYPIFRLNS